MAADAIEHGGLVVAGGAERARPAQPSRGDRRTGQPAHDQYWFGGCCSTRGIATTATVGGLVVAKNTDK